MCVSSVQRAESRPAAACPKSAGAVAEVPRSRRVQQRWAAENREEKDEGTAACDGDVARAVVAQAAAAPVSSRRDNARAARRASARQPGRQRPGRLLAHLAQPGACAARGVSAASQREGTFWARFWTGATPRTSGVEPPLAALRVDEAQALGFARAAQRHQRPAGTRLFRGAAAVGYVGYASSAPPQTPRRARRWACPGARAHGTHPKQMRQ